MSSVDVIVPCYRYGHFLRECVESVLAQEINVRVLIIDDASPDNTAEVAAELAREDSRVSFLRHTTNLGHIATYNKGIEWASADYLLILSADDYLLPDSLSRAANLMDTHPEVGFTFGNVIQLSDTGQKCPMKTFSTTHHKEKWRIFTGLEFIEQSGSTSIVWTPTAIVRTELQKQLGGYRLELPHTGDMEMWLRFAAHASVGFLEEYQAVYRRHGDNMSLGYEAKNWLPAVQQRKTALDVFFENSMLNLSSARKLRRRKFRSLACEAIGLASAAFNLGKMEESERLSEFALSVCPEVKRSLPWLKLACKRRMGNQTWVVALQPTICAIRKVGASLKAGCSR